MKRLLALLSAALVTLGAAAHTIRDLDITVEVSRDGSAWVTQRWDVDVTQENTEWFIPVENLGPMTVGQLEVSEDGVAFQSLGNKWDVDRSRSWKTGKCGMVPKRDGAELCWGLGAAGRHHWVVRFRLTGLVQAFDDADAFAFMFVTPGMNRPPEHARVTIVPAFDCPVWTYDNTRVWAFGFYGDIHVVDGKVVAESSESFSSSSRLIALVKFNQGLFQPAVEHGGPFQAFLDKALEGSSYEEEDGPPVWFIVVFAVAFLGGLALIIWIALASALGYKYKKSIYGRTKIDGWYRDIPLEGNLHAADYLLSKGMRFASGAPANNLIGAFFLRWVMKGLVKVQPDPKSSKRVNLAFVEVYCGGDEIEEDLYQMARGAAGDNQLLERGEFENWSAKNYKKLTAWPERSAARGRRWFNEKGYFVKSGVCTTEGAAQACHLIEFRNFLKDFTLSGERGSAEVGLWKDYLVYAQLFGIADKVAKQFKKLYPATFDQLAAQSGMDSTTLLYTMNWTNTMSTRAFSNAVSRAGNINGTGGHASFGGGGGFSGGGFGGGGR